MRFVFEVLVWFCYSACGGFAVALVRRCYDLRRFAKTSKQTNTQKSINNQTDKLMRRRGAWRPPGAPGRPTKRLGPARGLGVLGDAAVGARQGAPGRRGGLGTRQGPRSTDEAPDAPQEPRALRRLTLRGADQAAGSRRRGPWGDEAPGAR